jgi:tryptophan-rich sensory protein
MRKVIIFLICLAVVFSAGFIGSVFTSGNVSGEWYQMNKPQITPPGFIFPIVWNILFFLIALSLFLAWTKAKKKEKKKVTFVFGVNLVLNLLWNVLFFGLRKPGFAFADLILLLVTIILMIFVAGRIDRKAGWLLVPYLLWVTFAGVLNFLFWT